MSSSVQSSEARRGVGCGKKIAELRSAGQMRTSVPTWFVMELPILQRHETPSLQESCASLSNIIMILRRAVRI